MDKKQRKLRILISTNAIWAPSGYAQQAQDLLPLIRDEGYPLACSNFYGQEGGIFMLDGMLMYPKIADAWGSDAMVLHSQDFKADITMTLQDIWVLNDINIKDLKRFVPIIPVDHDPIPMTIFNKLRFAHKIITYSKFGHEQLEKLGMNSTYIPHTVNTEVFKPLNMKKQLRKLLNIPEDIFLFGMVAANKDNPSRKSFQEVLDAFKMFQTKHPASGIFFHVLLNQQGGFPIDQYAKAIRLNNIYNTPPYTQLFKTPKADMAKIYNVFDCLLAPSTNGGFEIPIIEAQACNVPAITNDFTAMKDLVIEGVTGYKTKVRHKRFTQLGSYIGEVDVDSLYEKMELVYVADREKMGAKGREFVVKEYDLMTVFREKWIPWLQATEDEIYKKT
jgi:glycosyltransferase involved in cell wall biosynthesis